MDFPSAVARRVDRPIHEFEPGDYLIRLDARRFTDGGAAVVCPTMYYMPPGCDMVYAAPLTKNESRQDKRGTSGTYWWWNGDLDRPTCKPSFGVPADPPYNWHGWLRNGRWEACE